MKTLPRRFAVLSIMLLPGACAVAPDKPVTLVSQPMSVGQARQAVLHMKGMSGSTGTSIGASTWTISNVTLNRTSLTVGRSHSRSRPSQSTDRSSRRSGGITPYWIRQQLARSDSACQPEVG